MHQRYSKYASSAARAQLPRSALSVLAAATDALPRPIRFLIVGALGLATDLSVFTAALALLPHPLVARAVSLGLATLLTWALNRSFTFERSGRRKPEEALRYAFVSAMAQGVSYAVFATLVLTVLARVPQLALLAGAATGAVFSYNGHRLFAFAAAQR